MTEAKYIDNKITMDIPAKIQKKWVSLIVKMQKATPSSGRLGLSRCDFFSKDGQVFLNEIIPYLGFTQWSMYPPLGKYGDITI